MAIGKKGPESPRYVECIFGVPFVEEIKQQRRRSTQRVNKDASEIFEFSNKLWSVVS